MSVADRIAQFNKKPAETPSTSSKPVVAASSGSVANRAAMFEAKAKTDDTSPAQPQPKAAGNNVAKLTSQFSKPAEAAPPAAAPKMPGKLQPQAFEEPKKAPAERAPPSDLPKGQVGQLRQQLAHLQFGGPPASVPKPAAKVINEESLEYSKPIRKRVATTKREFEF